MTFVNFHRLHKNGTGSDKAQVCSSTAEDSRTIYKTVDFAKTIALNRTKRDIESEREQAISEHTSNPNNMFSPLGSGVMGAVGANLLLNR